MPRSSEPRPGTSCWALPGPYTLDMLEVRECLASRAWFTIYEKVLPLQPPNPGPLRGICLWGQLYCLLRGCGSIRLVCECACKCAHTHRHTHKCPLSFTCHYLTTKVRQFLGLCLNFPAHESKETIHSCWRPYWWFVALKPHHLGKRWAWPWESVFLLKYSRFIILY